MSVAPHVFVGMSDSLGCLLDGLRLERTYFLDEVDRGVGSEQNLSMGVDHDKAWKRAPAKAVEQQPARCVAICKVYPERFESRVTKEPWKEVAV